MHLQETSPKSVILPYTTLSHCWGQLAIKKLEKDTLKDMVKKIAISELPKTFQDAVVVTRELGIRYLWVDSLCIIQDSAEDWATESSNMRLIYKNCILNIAATAAQDSSIGCFFDRNTNIVRPCRIEITETGIYDFLSSNAWFDDVISAPLNQRAWVVQEQLLAPRVLHFGKTQLFWECNETVSFSVSILFPLSVALQEFVTFFWHMKSIESSQDVHAI